MVRDDGDSGVDEKVLLYSYSRGEEACQSPRFLFIPRWTAGHGHQYDPFFSLLQLSGGFTDKLLQRKHDFSKVFVNECCGQVYRL